MVSPYLLWEKKYPRLGNLFRHVYLHAARQCQTQHTVKESIITTSSQAIWSNEQQTRKPLKHLHVQSHYCRVIREQH